MGDPDQSSAGLLGSLRRFVDTGLGAARNRLELLSVEVREEKSRLIEVLIWASAAIFLGMMALTFISFTIVILFWESARLAALIGISLFYLATAIAAFLGVKSRLTKGPMPFAESLSELDKDKEWVRSAK
jgi:uncharacterized membrane protein YqjE